jgi:hypothetical protein
MTSKTPKTSSSSKVTKPRPTKVTAGVKRAVRRDGSRPWFRPAIWVTERVDGLELIGRGRDEDRTGKPANDQA